MSNIITNYNVNVNGIKQDLGTIIQNNSTQTINIPTSGYTNILKNVDVDTNNQQVIYDNCIYPYMSGSSVNGNTSISFGAKKRYSDSGMWVAVGYGENTIAYSYDGINWIGLGNIIFTRYPGAYISPYNPQRYGGSNVAWNGFMWVAVGFGENTIAYSYDGINWTGCSTYLTIFSEAIGIAWNGFMWVAVGYGFNTSSDYRSNIAYSYDGINWSVSGIKLYGFDNKLKIWDVAWNGNMWVGAAERDYESSSIPYGGVCIYSYDGKNWTQTAVIFSIRARSISWNGNLWVVVGQGSAGSIAYSYDGIIWNIVAGISINSSGGYSVCWDGKKFIAVGDDTTNNLAYSYNGINWSRIDGPDTGGKSISWNGKNFVVVQTGQQTNNISYSSDGINWVGLGSSIFSGDTGNGGGVAWGGTNLTHTITFPRNLTLAGGSGTNSIAYSSDGIRWARVDNSLNTCNGITWNGTMWVAVGTGKSGKGPIAYSYDGSNNWLDTSSNVFTTGNGIAWNGKMWVAVGSGANSIAYSYDGITWSGVSGSSTILSIGRGIAWNNTKWVAVGKAGTHSIVNSFDGINWFGVTSTFLPNTNGANAIAWNGTIWVVGGFPIVASSNQTIAYSFDGSNNWTAGSATSICTTSCKSVAWNGYKWVAGGQGGSALATSSDGINWTSVSSTFTDCSGVTWNGTKWVAVGTLSSSRTIAYSSDGSNNWASIANSNSIFSSGGNAVAYNQNIPSVKIQHPTIAVGSGTNTIAYSPDGIRWTGLGKTIFSDAGGGVAWNGTKWVAVGNGINSIAYSYDGINWFGVTGKTIFLGYGSSVAWSGTRWVAVGGDFSGGTNSIAYSSDGITWTGLGKSVLNFGISVAWNGIQFLAGGSIFGSITNTIAYSSDGINWNKVTDSSSIFSFCNGFAWNGKLWVAVGEGTNYTIAYSYDGIFWSGVANSKIIFSNNCNEVAWNGKLFVAGGEGIGYSIAYSYDGITWSGVANSKTNVFNLRCLGITWNGLRFVAVGDGNDSQSGGKNSIAYSLDGSNNWTPVTDSRNIFQTGFGVAGNPKIGPVIVPSAIHLNNNINSNTLTLSSESYYQNGVNNISIDVNTM